MVRPHRVQLLVAGLIFCIFGSWRELIHVERVSATVAKERSSQERLRWSRRRSHGRWWRIRNRLHFGNRWASGCFLQILATANTKLARYPNNC
jgi:hypothetical protein